MLYIERPISNKKQNYPPKANMDNLMKIYLRVVSFLHCEITIGVTHSEINDLAFYNKHGINDKYSVVFVFFLASNSHLDLDMRPSLSTMKNLLLASSLLSPYLSYQTK